jgi:hypothetical protein
VHEIAKLACIERIIFLGGLVANKSEIAHLFGFFGLKRGELKIAYGFKHAIVQFRSIFILSSLPYSFVYICL